MMMNAPAGPMLSRTVATGHPPLNRAAAPPPPLYFAGKDESLPGSQNADTKPKAPTKAQKKNWVFRGTLREFGLLGVLSLLLGGAILAPQQSLDITKKTVAAVSQLPDDSRIYLSSDRDPKLAQVENNYAATFFKLAQSEDKHLQNFPQILNDCFPNSPGAAQRVAEFQAIMASAGPVLEEARQALTLPDNQSVTLDSILTTAQNRNTSVQTQRRTAWINYIEKTRAVSEKAAPVINETVLPARYQMAIRLDEMLQHWESGYESLFHPASDAPVDVEAFQAGKQQLKEQMAAVREVRQLLAPYGITPEGLLDASAMTPARTPTHAELATMIRLRYGLPSEMAEQIATETPQLVEQAKTQQGDLEALSQKVQRGEATEDELARATMEMQQGQMKAGELGQLLKSDPRTFFVQAYNGTVLDCFEWLGMASPKRIAQNEQTLANKVRKAASGETTYIPGEIENDQRNMERIHAHGRQFAGLWQASPIPPEIRQTLNSYNRLTNSEATEINNGEFGTTSAAFSRAMAVDHARLSFEGRWFDDHAALFFKPKEANPLSSFWLKRAN